MADPEPRRSSYVTSLPRDPGGASSAPMRPRALPDAKDGPECVGIQGRRYPFKVKLDDRYPMKDPAKYTEFERRYPPDRFGEEASDNARVWKLYRDRVTGRDEDQIEGWNKTIDILLIFAGLFSAVATAFIIESYKQLQPDYTEYLARAFAASLNRTDSGTLANPIPDLTSFRRPALARGVNTLWFLSLALALVSALLAILAKQWLNEYTSRMRRHISSHRRWAWRHFVYYGGLERWGLEGFISFLPVMLHAALLLFLAGLVGFLADIDWAIGSFILILTVSAVIFYVGSTLAPFWFGDCPTATPLLRQVRRAVHAFGDSWGSRLFSTRYVLRSYLGIGHGDQVKRKGMHVPAFSEDALLEGKGPTLDAKVLEWMITSLPASEEIDAALDAVGSLDPVEHQHMFHEECSGVYGEPLSGDPLCNVAIRSATFSRFWRLNETGHAAEAEVASTLRAMLFLCYNPFFDIADPLRLRDVNQAVYLTAFLDRWEKHTTHDLRLLATAVSRWFGLGFLDEVADNLAAWVDEGDHGDATGQLPYQASSLALSFLRPPAKPTAAEQAGFTKILCAVMSPLHSPTFTMAQRRALFSTVHANVHHIIPILPAPPMRSNYLSLTQMPAQCRIRTLATLAAVMRNGEQLLGPGTLEIVSQTFSHGCQLGVDGLTIADLKDVLGIVEFSKLHQGLEETESIAFLFSRFVRRVDFWSAEVGVVGRHLLSSIAKAPQHVERMHGTLFFLFGPDNCSVVAHHLAETYSSVTDAELHSRINLLVEDTDGQRCWDQLWAIDKSDLEEDLCSPTQALITHLCILKRSGLDVGDYTQQVLGHNRGYRALCGISYPPVAVRLAQHGRELSPEWWETTKAQLIATHQVSGDGAVPPATTTFIEQVDSLGPCVDCPSYLQFRVPSINLDAAEPSSHHVRTAPSCFRRLMNRDESSTKSNHPGSEVHV